MKKNEYVYEMINLFGIWKKVFKLKKSVVFLSLLIVRRIISVAISTIMVQAYFRSGILFWPDQLFWLKSWKFMIRSFAIGFIENLFCNFRKDFSQLCSKLESHLITHLIFSWHQNLNQKGNGSFGSFENISPRNY